MEVLSGVASGMAVVSLSIQLIQSVENIRSLIRNVKDASVQLRRLAELLARLNAILQDIRDLLEQQSVLQSRMEHFPVSSPIMKLCLQSCEETLQPLEKLLKKHQNMPPGSALTQIRKDIRLGFKAKDIAAFETKIQYEINYLNTALLTNTNTILMNALPALQKPHQDGALAQPYKPSSLDLSKGSDIVQICSEREVNHDISEPRFIRRTAETTSALQKFGMRQRKTTRYMCTPKNQQDQKSPDYYEKFIAEENEYMISWTYLGLGIRWTRQPGTRILPSLTTYPVVRVFSEYTLITFILESVQSIQEMFSSGEVHPYTREEWSGRSLLHMAIHFGRSDIYRLLIEYGVKPDVDDFGYSPIRFAMEGSYRIRSSRDKCITIYRLLINDLDQFEDFQSDSWIGISCENDRVHEMLWLWQQSLHVLFGHALFQFQIILIRTVLQCIVREQSEERKENILCTWVKLIGGELRDEIESGRFQMLRSLWSGKLTSLEHYSMDSCNEGSALVAVLSRLKINIQTWITRELEALEHGILQDQYGVLPNKKIISKQDSGGGWTIRWEWAYEQHGRIGEVYPVLSEYETLATVLRRKYWPFSDGYCIFDDKMLEDRKKNSRFQRRMVTKSRKERARSGQKQQRCKMPGSWVS